MFFIIIAAGIVLAFVLSMIFRSNAMRRALWHKSPFPEAGGQGPMTELAPVETGIVMSVDISRLLALYLLDLASYNDLKILELAPLKVQVLAQGDIPQFRQRFLAAVNEDGSLDPDKMLLALDFLYDDLKGHIRNYCVKETVVCYLKKVDDLWERIQKERTTSAKLQSLEEHFPWLLMHEDSAEQLEQSFRTSPHWPTVQPIVRKLRLIKDRIVTNEVLLEHAANHPGGIFSNKSYRDSIVHWATTYLRHSSLAESRGVAFSHYVDDKIEELRDKQREELKKKLDRMQHLLEMIENADT
jgi:hypothetical protein